MSNFGDFYSDLLSFETDFAQITDLVLLFCESAGSLAELGAFSAIREIASKLLVVIFEKYWNDDSFVRLGPLRALEKGFGPNSAYVIDEADIEWSPFCKPYINLDSFKQRLQNPIASRMHDARAATTFDKQFVGHKIKLIVGLIQEYGALTIQEIEILLHRVAIVENNEKILAYLLCAMSVGWVVKKRKGWNDYYTAKNLRDAATSMFSENVAVKIKVRRRADIRQYWKQNDNLRFSAIKEVFGGIGV